MATIDRTLTAAGARLLADHLSAPLTEPAAVAARLDAVGFFIDGPELSAAVRDRLRHCPDIERALTRLSLGRGGPRDLAALRQSLGETAAFRNLLDEPALVPLPRLLAAAQRGLGEHAVLVDRLGRALAEELPLFARDGGFIAAEYSDELDEWRRLRDESRRMIAALQAQYAAETAVAALKIRHNNVIGYYIEVSASQAGKLGPEFIHRQTMAGAQRYTTAELAQLETKIASAAERALALELRLYDDLVGEVMARRAEIAEAAAALASLDVAAALAERATEGGWARPIVEAAPPSRYPAGGIRLSRRGSRRRAPAAALSPMIARLARNGSGCYRTEYGGEKHFPAAKRIDRHPGADRVVCARTRGADRHCRSSVQPRGCRRRSGARPLDVYGRDG